MSELHDYIGTHMSRFRDELFDFLRIPSVSARSEHNEDTLRTARWFQDRLKDAGLEAEIFETQGHPIVLGEWRGAGNDAPTILVYGHYDVQPVEPLDEWTSPPFEPEIRDGRVYARGSADDKGQLYMHVKALEAHLAVHGTLPANVVVVAEGEEEVGSENLLPFVMANKDRLACDVVVISDSGMFDEGIPSLLFSLRGLVYLELRLRTSSTDLHSGAYGGGVPNPANTLARLVADLHDEKGRIAVEGFYDDVLEWDEETRSRIRALPFSDEDFAGSISAPALSGEEGYSTLERLWIRPTCDVNGFLSGYTGEGAKTVLPAKAMAKVSFRLVPDQDPKKIAGLVRAHLARHTPEGLEVEVEMIHGGHPWRANPEGWVFEAASRAVEASFGREPVLVGEGGSIPIVVDFERELDAPALLVGFALPNCNMHAPDEWLSLENFETGIGTLAELYQELAEAYPG